MDSKQATIWLRTILKCKQNNSTMKKRLAVRKEQELCRLDFRASRGLVRSRFFRAPRGAAVRPPAQRAGAERIYAYIR